VRQFLTTAAMSQHADCLHRLSLGRRAVARLFGPLKTPLILQDTSTERLFPTSSLSSSTLAPRHEQIVHAENREDQIQRHTPCTPSPKATMHTRAIDMSEKSGVAVREPRLPSSLPSNPAPLANNCFLSCGALHSQMCFAPENR
jgi:hypothetical protein